MDKEIEPLVVTADFLGQIDGSAQGFVVDRPAVGVPEQPVVGEADQAGLVVLRLVGQPLSCLAGKPMALDPEAMAACACSR